MDESGNVWKPRGPETLAVAGIYVAGVGVRQLRRHAEQARRRIRRDSPDELRYRLGDHRSKQYFFHPDRLHALPIRVWGLCASIRDMDSFRAKHNPAGLYEWMLERLVAEVTDALDDAPEILHFDPCSSFVSRTEFTRRLTGRFPGSRVLFAPDSQREKGLQAADMVAGAARRSILVPDVPHWSTLVAACGATLGVLEEEEVRQGLRK